MGAELGKYKACVSARSTDKEILKHAQDGGIVTSLFGYALDAGIIDGAIVAATKEFAHKHPEKAMRDNSNMEFHEPWRPIPVDCYIKGGSACSSRHQVQHQPERLHDQGGNPQLSAWTRSVSLEPPARCRQSGNSSSTRSVPVTLAPALLLQSVSSAWRTSRTRASSSSWKTTRR